MTLFVPAVLCLAQSAHASLAIGKERIVNDSHPVPFKLGPPVPFRPRSRCWIYVDVRQHIAWQFEHMKVVWACRVSVAGKGHPQMRGWKPIKRIVHNPEWHPGPGAIKMYRKNHRRALPSIVKGGDPRNELGSMKWELNPPYHVHGNNDASSVGTYSLGCLVLGNRDIHIMVLNGIKKGSQIFFSN
jgi:lipoprotein-anchoring transpeptidase ErfK/SrfK